jgi:hypothetical protein
MDRRVSWWFSEGPIGKRDQRIREGSAASGAGIVAGGGFCIEVRGQDTVRQRTLGVPVEQVMLVQRWFG